MKLVEFDEFLCNEIIPAIQETLNDKSSDYSTWEDKLSNFKRQAKIADLDKYECLRGNWLKHLESIMTGIDETTAVGGALRSYSWWKEKCIDSINYHILLLAMVKEDIDNFYNGVADGEDD